jgi:PIN domain nuclease of toxin-antitoxin system
MIDANKLPQDKVGKTIALSAISSQFEEMAAQMAEGKLKELSDFDQYVWSVINEATNVLEG